MNTIITAQNNQIKTENAVSQSDQQRQIAEVQASMMIAKMNPRNEMKSLEKIKNACMRVSLAESALYAYARGGANITGASIRLAEAIAQLWGNIQFGMREISQQKGESVVQTYAWDVENNTRREITFTVKHKRYTKRGVKELIDPRDIYEMVANQGARRMRACILAIIPSDIVDEAIKQCEQTLTTKVDITPESIQNMIKAFKDNFGVTKSQIEKKIQRSITSIEPTQFLSLKKIYKSLKDDMSSVEDWFDKETKPSLNEIQHNTQTGEIIEQKESSKLDTYLPQLIKSGVKRTQIDEFCKRYNITDENVESILSDRDGLNDLVAKFNGVEI